MSKAPLLRDVLLGDINGSIVGTETGVTVNLMGHTVNAKQLRAMADQLDAMQAAVNAFYGVKEQEFAVTFTTGNIEDNVIIKAIDADDARGKFIGLYKTVPNTTIRLIYNRDTNQYVEF